MVVKSKVAVYWRGYGGCKLINQKWQNSYDQGGGKTKLFRKAGVTLLLSVVDLYKFCANKNIERIKVFFKSWPHFPSFLASLKKTPNKIHK